MRKLIAVFLLLVIPFSLCQEVRTWNARAEIGENGFTELEILLVLDSTKGNLVELEGLECSSLSLYDETGPLDYSLSGSSISFMARGASESYSFSLVCVSGEMTSKEESWLFSLKMPFEGSNGSLVVVLPPNAFLTKSVPEGAVFAEDSRLSLRFIDADEVSVLYSFSGPAERKGDYTGMPVAVAVAVAVGLAFIYLKGMKKRREGFLKYLGDNERKVAGIVQDKGRITQKMLRIESGLPKSTLSRTVRSLENKGIVKTVSAGSTKFVELKK
jgi:uncharacterized membrane protein